MLIDKFYRFNKYLFVFLSISFLLVTSSLATSTTEKILPGEVIVKFKKDIQIKGSISAFSAEPSVKTTSDSINTLMAKIDVSEIKEMFKKMPSPGILAQAVNEKVQKRSKRIHKGAVPPDLSNVYKLSFSKELDVQTVIEEFRKDPNVEFVQPNYIYKASYSRLPNLQYTDDPYLYSSGSWGQSYPDLWGLYKIKAPEAWDIITGSDEVVVAVVDTGVDYNHEDLQGKVTLGFDFADYDSDPMDDMGRGTHVAGIIAASKYEGSSII